MTRAGHPDTGTSEPRRKNRRASRRRISMRRESYRRASFLKRLRGSRKALVLIGAGALAAVIGAGAVLAIHTNPVAAASTSRIVMTSPTKISEQPPAALTEPTPAVLAAVPEARYSAVIPGLISATTVVASAATNTVYQLVSDTPVYGADKATLVARLAANNFLGHPTVVVPIQTSGQWVLVLTPARNALPSGANNSASAQTAGWIHATALTHPTVLTQRVVISASAQRLSIQNSDGTIAATFAIGVGTAATPSPTGVTGYLQERYVDAAQGQAKYPIQLTSLHSAVADNPYGGSDGGLIGVHYEAVNTGAVSHGCIRVSAAAVTAITALPLGTLVVMEN